MLKCLCDVLVLKNLLQTVRLSEDIKNHWLYILHFVTCPFPFFVQALSLLLAMILRAMVPARRVDYDSDEDFVVIRRPLLDPQGGPGYATTSVGSKGFHSDFWSSQMRQKVLHRFRSNIFPYSSWHFPYYTISSMV